PGISATRQADQAPTVASAERPQGRREPGVGVEGGTGVGRTAAGLGDEELEQIAGHDQRAGTAPRLDGAGQVGRGGGRGGRRRGTEEKIAHHEHPPTEPDLDLELVDEVVWPASRAGPDVAGKGHAEPSWQPFGPGLTNRLK